MKIYLTLCLLVIIPLQAFGSLSFQKGAGEQTINYPLTSQNIGKLQENTLWQGYTLDDKRVRITQERLDNNAGPQQGTPLFEAEMLVTAAATYLAKHEVPFSDTSVDWSYFEVAGLKQDRSYVSDILKKYNIKTAGDLARVVHQDRPTQIIDDALEWLAKRGTKRRTGLLLETPFGRQFTETTVCDEALAGATVLHTSYSAFAAKYYFGFPRPEEIFSALANKTFTVSSITHKNIIPLLDMQTIAVMPEKFTLYPEGAPNHPSRPAMHSSVASILYMLDILYELDEYEKDQILRLQSNLAFGRTFAGVHRPYDNIQGINLGIHVMREGLIQELLAMSGIAYDPLILETAMKDASLEVKYKF